jgi:ribosomal protein L44E
MLGNLGKLKQTLKETCQECNTRLELRSVPESYLREGETIDFHVDRKYCPTCDEFTGKENVRQSKPWKRENGNFD